MNLSFPNLRVLRLERIGAQIPLVFDFIQRHSTILEANVQFASSMAQERYLMVESLFPLIYGTGTWIAPSESGIVLAQPTNAALNFVHSMPPNSPESFGPCYQFAFERTPISPDAIQHCSSIGSVEPRYKCIAFAASFGNPSTDDMYTEEYSSLDVLLPELRSRLPCVQIYVLQRERYPLLGWPSLG